jgi:arabinofuranan 3-O-arabinosyltransferase
MQTGLLLFAGALGLEARDRRGSFMAPPSTPMRPVESAVPKALFNICFVLFVINVSFFPIAYFSHWWIYDPDGQGIPTDFINVFAAGRMVRDGHPALAFDWDLQKQIELDVLKQDFDGYFAWHYPPPFLFVAAFLAQFPYSVAFIGWVSASILPYIAVMRLIVGRSFGLMLALAVPLVLNNALVGQNGFLTAALIGGTLFFLPMRPVVSGICLGLLTYKPQYGLLFPLVLIAAKEWRVFFTAATVAMLLALVSWLAFGTESWQAFFHWMPMFSQAFLVEGKATWWKLQSVLSLVRYFGGSEHLAWTLQWVMTTSVAVTLVAIWRSSVRYSLKAASLAVGTLLVTPYLFLYDMMVLAIPVAYLVRLGLARGFLSLELPALAVVVALILSFIVSGAPVGLAAELIVAALVLRRAGHWWRREPAAVPAPAGV